MKPGTWYRAKGSKTAHRVGSVAASGKRTVTAACGKARKPLADCAPVTSWEGVARCQACDVARVV